MKILAICGSPRKGTGYSVLRSIQAAYPMIDFKIIQLSNKNLLGCKGCYTCVLKGEAYCPLNDDRDDIIQQMQAADGVVFASPVFVNHISALMKTLFERLGYMAHRPNFYDKFAMVLSTCKGFGTKSANDYMKGIVNSFGFTVAATLELQFSTHSEKEELYNFKKTILAFNALIDSIKKGERKSPTLTNLVMFQLFKLVSEKYKKTYTADYEYYKDKAEFPYDGKINIFKKKIAKRYVQKFANELAMNR